MLKTSTKHLLKIPSPQNSHHITKTLLHTNYDPQCFSHLAINSLRTRQISKNFKISDLSFGGRPISLGFYDSHRFDRRSQYSQATQDIVLVLPSGGACTQDYAEVIGCLVNGKLRVLSVEFPGCGQSRLVEASEAYTSEMIQKTAIVKDFLNLRLPNRKK